MRSIGVAQYALDLMIQRVTDPSRKTFGKYLYKHGTCLLLNLRPLQNLIFSTKALLLRTSLLLEPRLRLLACLS